MKLQIASDLHIEISPFEPPDTDADVIVLAGDIHNGLKGLKWIRNQRFGKPVVYVLGNHEYYGNSMPRLVEKMRCAAEGSNVHLLERERVTIGDVCFLGCTLWTDFKLLGTETTSRAEAGYRMNDYHRIRVNPEYRKLQPLDTLTVHRDSLNWIEKAVTKSSSHQTVVISHHAPSSLSLAEQYPSEPLSPAYASDLADFIDASSVSMWIHGHIHKSLNYSIGQTRIICNPRGYFGSFNPEFNPALVMEL
jgi:Icc-related predicted phosphoesterase